MIRKDKQYSKAGDAKKPKKNPVEQSVGNAMTGKKVEQGADAGKGKTVEQGEMDGKKGKMVERGQGELRKKTNQIKIGGTTKLKHQNSGEETQKGKQYTG